jgi:uncharacterized RDD family membrane protein YckC
MQNSIPNAATPSIKRRLIAMVYEALLLFAVVFLVDLVLDIVTQSRHALALRQLRQFVLFLVMAAYFAHFWCREGQTLAMKTWRIRLIKPGHARVPLRLGVARYLLAWMWFLPALLTNYAFGLKTWSGLAVIAAGMAAWAATALFDKDGQFLHDRLVGTRLIELPAIKKIKPAAA